MSEHQVSEIDVDPGELRSLLRKTVAEVGVSVNERSIEQMTVHFAMLLKWNRKINLTSLIRVEEIATRHFGESLYLHKVCKELDAQRDGMLVDVGSGAGFPGLPLKAAQPDLATVLLESNKKKATFLKEVVRSAGLEKIDVRALRLDEALAGGNATKDCLRERASIVTMRAVAVSSGILSDLRKLLRPSGRLALFLGEQDAMAVKKLPFFEWETPKQIPHSKRRAIMIGKAS